MTRPPLPIRRTQASADDDTANGGIMNHRSARLLQIMPADGWRWFYRDEWPGDPDRPAQSWPLTAWALVEWTYCGSDEGTEVEVEGVDMGTDAPYGLVYYEAIGSGDLRDYGYFLPEPDE